MAAQPQLTEFQTSTYDLWLEIRDHIEIELSQIERALRGDPNQVGSSTEAVYSSAERLKELVPELKQIAKALEDQEFRETLARLPR